VVTAVLPERQPAHLTIEWRGRLVVRGMTTGCGSTMTMNRQWLWGLQPTAVARTIGCAPGTCVSPPWHTTIAAVNTNTNVNMNMNLDLNMNPHPVARVAWTEHQQHQQQLRVQKSGLIHAHIRPARP